MKTKRRWFLIPLLAVVLVGLGFAYAALARARERARRKKCWANLVIGHMCYHYADDSGGEFPPTLGVLFGSYVTDGEVFLCPSAGKATEFILGSDLAWKNFTPAMFGDTHTDYVYVSGLRADDPVGYILIFDDEWNHDGDGVNVYTTGRGGGWVSDIKAVHQQLARQEKELAAQGRRMTIRRPAWSSWPAPPVDPRSVPEARREARQRELEVELKEWLAKDAAGKAEEEHAAEERRRRNVENAARLAAEDRNHVEQALLALSSDLPPTLTLDLRGGVTMELTLIPAGEFLMGSPRWDGRPHFADGPVHRVRITRPFYMGRYEVTQAQYGRMMGENPSEFRGPDLPVEEVRWSEAAKFCRRLSQRTGKVVRLPTEAEWEYACRAGTKMPYFIDDGRSFDDYAWHTMNSGKRTHPVGGKLPNAWGLHDMYGNVWEWCSDWYDDEYYAKSPEENPRGPASMPTHWTWGGCRVLRGGSCYTTYWATSRYWGVPASGWGFRVVAAAPEP
ncbi:MAG: formylglycine-generating enzyme family protein [Planctomycetota bacterium]